MIQILTPTGYKDISTVNVGDQVKGYTPASALPVTNTILAIQFVDLTEWQRWWSVEPTVPPFNFYLINGTYTLNGEQSIWRGSQLVHVRDLVVGDSIWNDTNHPFTITSISTVSAPGWWRLEISGNHAYIIDGVEVHNASRFWVGGTGTWDSSTTTHWAATTGGAGGQSVPGSADTVTFDGSSGGGTVTPNFGGTITIQSLTGGAFTGTFDNSTNNNNFTLGANSGQILSLGGSGVRTFNLGTATWTFTANGSATLVNLFANTNMTFVGTNASLVMTATTASTRNMTLTGTPYTFASLTVNANTSGGAFQINNNTVTFTNLTINAPNFIQFPGGATTTITNAFSITGTSSTEVGIQSGTVGTQATISSANNGTLAWCGLHDMKFQGGGTFTATSSLDLGNNTGITITAPSAGGGGLLVNPGMTGGING